MSLQYHYMHIFQDLDSNGVPYVTCGGGIPLTFRQHPVNGFKDVNFANMLSDYGYDGFKFQMYDKDFGMLLMRTLEPLSRGPTV